MFEKEVFEELFEKFDEINVARKGALAIATVETAELIKDEERTALKLTLSMGDFPLSGLFIHEIELHPSDETSFKLRHDFARYQFKIEDIDTITNKKSKKRRKKKLRQLKGSELLIHFIGRDYKYEIEILGLHMASPAMLELDQITK